MRPLSALLISSYSLFLYAYADPRDLHSFPTRRSSDLRWRGRRRHRLVGHRPRRHPRSEEHTSELQSLTNLVCRLLLEKKKRRMTSTYVLKDKKTRNSHTNLICV